MNTKPEDTVLAGWKEDENVKAKDKKPEMADPT